jgi:hypothetical protein
MMPFSVEETLRRIEQKAALVRYLADAPAGRPFVPDPGVIAGLADLFAEVEQAMRDVLRALPRSVLSTQVTPSP